MKELVIPYGTKEITDQNFDEYERIIIPSTVKKITNSFNNDKIKEVVFLNELNNNEELQGTNYIDKSFNNTSIIRIEFPISVKDIRQSFRNSKIEKINFKFSEKPNGKIKGVQKILLGSFDNTLISNIQIPPSVITIDSSFKDCTKLKDLSFKTTVDKEGKEHGIQKLTNNSFYNIRTTKISIPSTLRVNTSQLPIHSINFSRGNSFPSRQSRPKIQPVLIARTTKSEKITNDNKLLYDYVNGCIAINEDGKTNEMNIDKTQSQNFSSALKILLKNYKITVDENQNNPYILSVTGINNNILVIEINGTNVSLYFPDTISEGQYTALMRIMNKMKQKEMNNNNKFNVTLFYKDVIYDKKQDGNIILDDIKPFIKANLMNNTHKL